jgi:hypothetical protein
MTLASDKAYRFAVGDQDSPRSSIWRLWSNSDEIYLGVRSKAGIFKLSFHGSGVCHFALTSQFAEEVSEQLKLTRQERTISRWRRSVAPDNEKLLYCVVVPQFCLRSEPLNNEDIGKVVWHSQPGDGNMRIFSLTIQHTQAQTADVMPSLIRWDLLNGETLRLYTSVAPLAENLLKEYGNVCNKLSTTKTVELGVDKLPEGPNRMVLMMTRGDGVKFAIDVPIELTYDGKTEERN